MAKRITAKHEEEIVPVFVDPPHPEEFVKADDFVKALEEISPDDEVIELPLTQKELRDVRWILFGVCPICHECIANWSPGAFNPARYQKFQDDGIDALSGHKADCSEKYLRWDSLNRA